VRHSRFWVISLVLRERRGGGGGGEINWSKVQTSKEFLVVILWPHIIGNIFQWWCLRTWVHEWWGYIIMDGINEGGRWALVRMVGRSFNPFLVCMHEQEWVVGELT
jgi:hypothetical protein